ncbi:putative nucleotide-binding alpha-beta plait domain, NTF2-like domain-containing protein [Rosa chinensis]|uniref:Putative nucleotide-binding alpha-beta plait domain, NTF2-like domain-containing protein n=1 Tax=Rosa chinensis TaxID=74649 RepID=A0A2P6R2H7_ROSCH|nr:nuclear transport factor 2 [Rosa chinensis]XP_040374851.1 nuclear transport factor 2 [Rosa chinensis]PRQ40631.1 putative nucleotide-binding alpha-beta plait domain, NTF2-like domain-containing protein [Rosa chinensis]
MANQTEDPPIPSAEIVGTAFVRQYYTILNQSPHEVYKFYSKDSLLSRPEADGTMTTVETVQAINEKILSLDCPSIHILTVDSQFSLANGVIVLVTGNIVGNDKVKRRFTQTFFLATQETGGYFVLNDMFKFVIDDNTNEYTPGYVAEETPNVPLNPNDELCAVTDEPIPTQTTYVEVDSANANEVNHVLKNCEESEKNVISEKSVVAEKSVVVEKGVDARQGVANHVNEAASSASSNIQKDAPKKTFASVVNALSVNKAPFNVRAPPPKPVERPRATAPAPVAPEALTRNNSTASSVEKNNGPAVKVHAIFVASLPMSATVEELDKLFKQFGSIKHDGIQVRSNKIQGTCFGFVEFESASSMQSAIKASPIEFGSRLLSIEERRANNDRGKFPSGKGGYRNDNFRGRENYSGGGGRGNYGGGRGYGRNDLRGESSQFSGQARGNGGRYGERPYQNGGKVVRQTAKPLAAA